MQNLLSDWLWVPLLYVFQANKVKVYVVTTYDWLFHLKFDKCYSQGVALRWTVMGWPIDQLCVTLKCTKFVAIFICMILKKKKKLHSP